VSASPCKHPAIDAIWRIESPKLIAILTRITGDLDLAEDVCQDALIAALEQWPKQGIPENPAGWLITAAKHRAVDVFRKRQRIAPKHEELGRELQERELAVPDLDAALDVEIEDDLLRLIFIACHPVISPEARVSLTLRLLGGLTTGEIARAFLISEATVAQRIVRAKRILAKERVPFEVPKGAAFDQRLSSVLAVIYLIFNEGYSATAGQDWIRPSLCEESLRLGRILAGLAPGEAEVHGLVSLMEIQASRLKARVGLDGEPILLLDQNRALWDRLLIHRGLAALDRAEATARERGPYTIQAAIAACHARALTAADTDWPRIVHLYGELGEAAPSPIIELNRAVAVSMAEGPAVALAIADELMLEPALAGYHLLPSARGEFLFRLGRLEEAQAEFRRAAELTANDRERAILLARADKCPVE
jgi:RNA polymerase sigma factor (sigma-70 family)